MTASQSPYRVARVPPAGGPPASFTPARRGPTARHGRARGLIPALLAVLVAVLAAGGWPPPVAADDGSALFPDPKEQTVKPGDTVVVTVRQSAPVATTGAQTNVVFDQKLLLLQDFALEEPYTSRNAVFAFGNNDEGTANDKGKAVAAANESGTLENVAGFLLPGSGTIPAGDQPFLKLTFLAQGGEGGKFTLLLNQGYLIDEQGVPLDPVVKFGTLIVEPGAMPSGAIPGGSGDPGASAAATLEPTVAPAPPENPTEPVAISLAPTTLDLTTGNQARVFLIINANGNLSSAVADFTFDPAKLEILGVEVGPPWAGGVPIAVATDPAKRGIDGAIAEANTTGVLQAVGAFFPPGVQDLPYGEGPFVSVLVRAKTDGVSTLSIGNASVLGVEGEDLPAVVAADSQTAAPEKPLVLDMTLVVPLVILGVLALVAIVVWRTGRIPARVRRRWPYYVAMVLGLIPVVLFAVMVVTLIVNAAPVVADPGIGALFGGTFKDVKGNMTAGINILAPAWVSLLITAIAAAVAIPVSLALAVTSVDFPMGPVGRMVRPVIAVLTGVPPIIYAVSAPFFVIAFMIPKFAANMQTDEFELRGPAAIGADPATWPPPGVPYSPGSYPWTPQEANSILLAGLLVGLFLIPFLAPLFVDALRDVPRAAREGSLALGANRTYTLRRVVLPRALPALVGASGLAILKALGESVIILFAAGIAGVFPSPMMDVLERSTGLAAWGTGIIRSLEFRDLTCNAQMCPVGYTSALVLLVIAFFVVIGLSILQSRQRRRVAT